MGNENMFSGILVPNQISYRIAPTGGDRIGLGIINKNQPADRFNGPESFPYFAISLVLRGRGGYEDCATGRNYPLEPGQLFMRQPGVEHIIRIDTASNFLELFLDLGNFAWPYFKNYHLLSDDTPVGAFQPDDTWLQEFRHLLREFPRATDDHLSELFMRLFSLASRCVRDIHRTGREENMVHDACMYLCADFSERKDLRAFCRARGWGYENFRKIFTRRMGISPNRYRIRRRMDTARALLIQKGLSIQAISSMLGYRTAYEFSTKFKAYFGVPPTAFRRRLPPESFTGIGSISAVSDACGSPDEPNQPETLTSPSGKG